MYLLRSALALVACLIVSMYVAIALVIAGPVTPISLELAPLAAKFEPYLAQSWQLFGPDPVSEERGVLARTRCGDATSGFADVTSASIEKVQASRLFPSRENRIVGNLLVARFARDDVTARLERDEHASDFPGLERPRRDEERRTERLIARYAAHQLMCPEGAWPDAVQLRYVFHAFPGWSERTEVGARGDVRYFDSRWIDPR